MKLALLLAVLTVASAANGQGTFRNMDFGLSQVPSSTPWGTVVPVNQALPFWTAYYAGTNQVPGVLYNSEHIGSASVDLLSPDDTRDGGIPGHFTAVLQAGTSGLSFASVALAQTAQVPVGTMSLLFVATSPNGGGWQVSVGGQTIPVVEVSQVDSRFNEYGANISAFAGLTEELRFTALPGTSGANMWLGEIQLSPIAVPEPSTVSLAALAGLVLLNKSMMTNRRSPLPLSPKRELGRAVHAPSLLPAAVAYLVRSPT